KVQWQSDLDSVGTGSQEITESVADQRIETALDFGQQGTATAGFDFRPSGEATVVTWRFKTDVGNNPIMRWMGLMFDTWVGEQYEKGLANLKVEAEKT
ncbi:MAG: SRPBCC family protein, partial [Hyphomicrobiaceae bacterium]